MKNEEIIESELWAESIFGNASRKGLVRLSQGISWEVVISPAEARRFALTVLEAADAAESDEFVLKFIGDRVGLSDDQLVLVLRDFREFRSMQATKHTENIGGTE